MRETLEIAATQGSLNAGVMRVRKGVARRRPPRRAGILLTLLCALAAWGASTAAEVPEAELQPVADVEAFIDDVERSLKGARTVFSRFRQERVLSLFDEPLVTEGILLFEQPDRVRWETTHPYRSVLLADGRRVAQFEWIEGKRRKINIGYPEAIRRMMSEIAAVNQGRMRERTKLYEVSGLRGAGARIIMRPREKALREMISSIEIDMTADLSATKRITMHEPNGDLTRIIVIEERRNVSVADGAFDLKDPIDVKAILAGLDGERNE